MDKFLKTIIREAGKMAKDYFSAGVEHTTKENPADTLTKADIAVSKYLVDVIHEKYPDHHIHSEEMKDDINPGADYEWIIDPIDGTRNFAMGISMWCNIIALMKDGKPYMAAVFNPNSDELFFAEAGKGSYKNGKKITVNNKDSFDHALGHVWRAGNDDGAYGAEIEKYKKANIKLVNHKNVWMHNIGSMISMCHLANGGYDFWIQNGGLEHDLIGPVLIAREAGAVVTHSDGSDWVRGRQDLVVANPNLHVEVLELFK